MCDVLIFSNVEQIIPKWEVCEKIPVVITLLESGRRISCRTIKEFHQELKMVLFCKIYLQKGPLPELPIKRYSKKELCKINATSNI